MQRQRQFRQQPARPGDAHQFMAQNTDFEIDDDEELESENNQAQRPVGSEVMGQARWQEEDDFKVHQVPNAGIPQARESDSATVNTFSSVSFLNITSTEGGLGGPGA